MFFKRLSLSYGLKEFFKLAQRIDFETVKKNNSRYLRKKCDQSENTYTNKNNIYQNKKAGE